MVLEETITVFIKTENYIYFLLTCIAQIKDSYLHSKWNFMKSYLSASYFLGVFFFKGNLFKGTSLVK